jgi:predicted ATPase/DNA-binding SARP family transcriptional activator
MNDRLEFRPLNQTRLEIYSLGGLQIKLDGQPLAELTSRSARALLVYLAYQDYPVSRLALAELLWPERTQAKALANLRVALHRMGALIGDLLKIQRELVSLSPGAVWLDTAELERRLDERQPAAALELFQGEFLEGFYLDGSRTFEDWQAEARERLRCDVLSALQELILQATGAGQTQAAIEYSERLLGLEPLHEPALCQLMRLLAQNGQRTAALAQYARFRMKIVEELGIEPEKSTLELAEQIKVGLIQPEPALYSNARPVQPDRRSPALPQPASALIGRQVELEELTQLFANPECRLLTLLGPGGIGKTRLALELAHSLENSNLDGACCISLAAISQPSQILPMIAAGLEFTPAPGGNPDEQLFRFLTQKEMLLVLDNFEQLIDPITATANLGGATGAEYISKLLKHTSRLKILVTSRQRLRLQGEWLFTLRGLSLASPAVELFSRSALRLRPDFRLEDDYQAVEEICRLLGGLPLAIELAAAWIPLLPARKIAENILCNLDFLVNRLADAPYQHRSIRALFEQSWQILNHEEKRLFTWMAVFAGGGRLEEIMAVCQAGPDLLLGLVDKSLIQESSPGRFSLHELLRQYALEALRGAEREWSEMAARRRHFDVYLALAEVADRHLRRAGQETWLARLDAERENFQAALEWALTGLDPDQAARLTISLGWYWRIRSQVEEAKRWLAQILLLKPLSLTNQAALLYHLGVCNWLQGEFDRAYLSLSKSCELWEQNGAAGQSGWAYSIHTVGMTDYQTERLAQAKVHFAASLEAFTLLGDEWGRGFSLGWLAKTYAALGEDDLARRDSQECVAIFRRIGDRFGLALFIMVDAWIAYDHNDLDQAQALAEEATQLRREIGHLHSLAEALSLQGAIAEKRDDKTTAIDHYREARTIYKSLGNLSYDDHLTQVITKLERSLQADS